MNYRNGVIKIYRVKVCFDCCEYIPILPDNYHNSKRVKEFEAMHYKHRVQTVNRGELTPKRKYDPVYVCIN